MTRIKNKAAFWMGLLVAGWLLSWVPIGCGVKGLPKPLWQRSVPRVEDLAGVVQGSLVNLTWSLSEPLDREQAQHAKFIIYGAKSTLENGDCEGCPQVFEKMAVIDYVDYDDERYEAQVPVEEKYRYVFKVNVVTSGGVGPDSDIVEIDGWSQTPAND